MIDYEFPDLFKCSLCHGEGFLVLVNYTIEQRIAIAKENNTYIKAGTGNHLHCPKCDGTGKSEKELKLEPKKKSKYVVD